MRRVSLPLRYAAPSLQRHCFDGLIRVVESMSERKQVLILCTGNSARNQMAEGLLRAMANDIVEVGSAGVSPSSVRPEAVAVMRERGIDISGHRSKAVDEF